MRKGQEGQESPEGSEPTQDDQSSPPSRKKEETLSEALEDNIVRLQALLGGGCDIKLHRFRFGSDPAVAGALFFVDGLVSSSQITDSILLPLTRHRESQEDFPRGKALLDALSQEVLCSGEVDETDSLTKLSGGCLAGDTVLLLEGCAAGLIINTKGWDKRSVSEPQSETVVRGPREGFTESLRTNTALLRRKLKTGRLKYEDLTVGRRTRTSISIMYLEDVAKPEVVEEVRYRINHLDVDSILGSGYIEEYIEDAPFSPFATVGYSEKPDVVAARILEGRVAIITDGTPFVLTAPMLFVESFQTAEDYYIRTIFASLTRLLRYAAYFISVFAPAIYIALTTFHQELIPTTLLLTIMEAREGTPFPVVLEALIMIFAFETLREAGIRLPRPVGQAISIVGALIMGDAAVSAGIVGAPIVITVAITAVSGFLSPTQSDSATILRILMLLLAAVVGFYGVAMGFLAMLVHLATLTSFGVPYFDGFSWSSNLQDSVIRMPLWSMVKRPENLAQGNIVRRKFFIPPLRPHEGRGQEEGKQA